MKDKTEAAYRRTDLFDKRRDLMALWAQFVTTKTAAVVPIPSLNRSGFPGLNRLGFAAHPLHT